MINQEVKEFMGILLHVVIELLWKEEENMINVVGMSNKSNTPLMNLIFVVPCIMLNSEINPTRCNNCVYSSQWLYSTCFG